MRLLREQPIEGYALQDHTTDPEYELNFAKLRDLHSELDELSGQDGNWHFKGCYIDIFPLLPSSSLWLHKRGMNAHHVLVRRPTRLAGARARRFMLRAGWGMFLYLAFPVFRLLGALGAGQRLRHIPGSVYHFERNAADFAEVKYVDFEGVPLPVPADADAYLTRIYGDWRRLPDPDKIEVHISKVTLH